MSLDPKQTQNANWSRRRLKYLTCTAANVFAKGTRSLDKWPRHEVTREPCKNYLLNDRLGRADRIQAIDRLIEVLIDEGVALPMKDFEKSYL